MTHRAMVRADALLVVGLGISSIKLNNKYVGLCLGLIYFGIVFKSISCFAAGIG